MLFHSDQGRQPSETLAELKRPKYKTGLFYESFVNPAWRRHQDLALCLDDFAWTSPWLLRGSGIRTKDYSCARKKRMLLFLLPTDTNITKGALQGLGFWEMILWGRKSFMLATWKESPVCRSFPSVKFDEPVWLPKIQKIQEGFLCHFGCLWVLSETVVLWVTNLYHRVVDYALS